MLPSIFGENLFDDFFSDPFGMMNVHGHDPLYGKHAKNLMKTDVRETENSYELDVDLPGFKKDEVNVDLKDGYLTISAAKGVDKDQQFLAPKLMLTSIVKRADRAVFEIVKATARGAFAGNEIITYDLANGGVDIVSPQVWARHAGVRLPAAIERRLAELRLELTRGGIRLPSLRDRTLCNCR